MKCTICGHATLPGATLCGPCRAALKRARYLSVQVVPPSSIMQGRPLRSRPKRAARTSPPAPPGAGKACAAPAAATARPVTAGPPPRPWWRTLGLAVCALGALGVVAWLGQPGRDPAPQAGPVAPGAARVVNVGALPAPAVAGASGAPATPPAVDRVPRPADAAAGIPPPVAKSARAQRPPAPPVAGPNDAAALAPGPLGAAYEMVPEAPRPAPAVPVPAPAPAPAPPPPDRWQTMRDDLARCDREGGFGGFICDQRVRLASCEGFWGRVPQCPLPPENPR